MKRFILFSLTIIFTFMLLNLSFGAGKKEAEKTKELSIITWEGYLPEDLIKEFEQKYELKAKLELDGKMYNSEVTEFNLFIGLDKILKKLESQIK